MNVTTEQIRKIHAIMPVNVKSNAAWKASIVSQFTGNASKRSTKNLTFSQANALIVFYNGKPLAYDHWAYFDKTNKQHLTILSLLMQLNWVTKKGYADLVRLSEFLKSNKSPVNKKLVNMQPFEVSKIIVAFQNMNR